MVHLRAVSTGLVTHNGSHYLTCSSSYLTDKIPAIPAAATEETEAELDLTELEDATSNNQLSATGVPDHSQLIEIWKMLMYFMFLGFLSKPNPRLANQPQSKPIRSNNA